MSAAAPPHHEERARERHAQARDPGARDRQHCALSPARSSRKRENRRQISRPDQRAKHGSLQKPSRAATTPRTSSSARAEIGRDQATHPIHAPNPPSAAARTLTLSPRHAQIAAKGHPARQTRSPRGDTKPPNSRISRTVRTAYRATVAPPIESTDEFVNKPRTVKSARQHAARSSRRHGTATRKLTVEPHRRYIEATLPEEQSRIEDL